MVVGTYSDCLVFPNCVFNSTVVWKNAKFTFFHQKILRQINYLVISLVTALLSRKFCKISVIFTQWTLSCTLWKLRSFPAPATIFSQKFRQINVLLKNLTINWFDGKSFEWQWISRFSTFWAAQYCTVWKKCSQWKSISSNQLLYLFSNFFSKSAAVTKFLSKCIAVW